MYLQCFSETLGFCSAHSFCYFFKKNQKNVKLTAAHQYGGAPQCGVAWSSPGVGSVILYLVGAATIIQQLELYGRLRITTGVHRPLHHGHNLGPHHRPAALHHLSHHRKLHICCCVNLLPACWNPAPRAWCLYKIFHLVIIGSVLGSLDLDSTLTEMEARSSLGVME